MGVLIVPPPSVSYDLERDAIGRVAIFGFFRAALATTGRRLNATPQGTLAKTGATVIEFLCPNGHRIRCPADQAGQPAKCPRCGVKFRIPSAEEIEVEESSPTDADDAPMDLPSSAPGGSSAPQGRPQKEPQIEFLCPNGHHLHGPASLQGRPGACPECGSRFRIPVIDEAPEENPPEQIDLPASGGEETGSATAKLRPAKTADAAAASLRNAVETPSGRSHLAVAGRQSAAPPSHPLAELVAQLWATKGEQAKVELRLAGGDSLVAESFVKGLSRGSYGVFGVKADDGNWTLTVVRWDTVERVVVKGLKDLPTF